MRVNRYYSHPILGIPGHFDNVAYRGSICTFKITKTEYEIKVKHTINDPQIMALVSGGDAVPVTIIRNKAYYWQSFVHNTVNTEHLIKIPKSLIRGNFELEIDFQISAKEVVGKYSNVNSSSIYSGYDFKLLQGEPFAIGSKLRIKLKPDYVEMSGGSSWMVFNFLDKSEKISYDIEDDRVVFYFPRKYEELFNNLNASSPIALVGVLVYPFIIELLNVVRKEPDAYEKDEKYTWVSTLIDILEKEDLRLFDDDQDVLELADVILDEPVYAALSDMENMRIRDNKDDDNE